MSLFLNLTSQGLINGAVYALIAIGLAMVFGLLRILHIAHAGLFALGGYLGWSSPTPRAASRSAWWCRWPRWPCAAC